MAYHSYVKWINDVAELPTSTFGSTHQAPLKAKFFPRSSGRISESFGRWMYFDYFGLLVLRTMPYTRAKINSGRSTGPNQQARAAFMAILMHQFRYEVVYATSVGSCIFCQVPMDLLLQAAASPLELMQPGWGTRAAELVNIAPTMQPCHIPWVNEWVKSLVGGMVT